MLTTAALSPIMPSCCSQCCTANMGHLGPKMKVVSPDYAEMTLSQVLDPNAPSAYVNVCISAAGTVTHRRTRISKLAPAAETRKNTPAFASGAPTPRRPA